MLQIIGQGVVFIHEAGQPVLSHLRQQLEADQQRLRAKHYSRTGLYTQITQFLRSLKRKSFLVTGDVCLFL